MDNQGLLQKFKELGKKSVPILATVTAISLALGLASTRYRVVPKDEAQAVEAAEGEAKPEHGEKAGHEAKAGQSEKSEHAAKTERGEESEHEAKAEHEKKTEHVAKGEPEGHSEHSAKAHVARQPAHAEETVAAIHPRPKKGWFRSLVNLYAGALGDIQDEVEHLKKVDEDNIRLRNENAHLRLSLESDRFSCYADHAEKLTREFSRTLSTETGSRTGRTLASIHYKVPADLMPEQLYQLGSQYFAAHDDEKAAVIFTFLSGLSDLDTYKNPRDWLVTGIAWYRLENFELAEFYFDKVYKTPENARDEQSRLVHGQVRLWKGLLAQRQGQRSRAQNWLREVLDHDPHGKEAAWVNNGDANRQPAAAEKQAGNEAGKHEHGGERE